jgi:lipopolysaccharide/colanic/teichoic acid biosynthesis glycosyltransferase
VHAEAILPVKAGFLVRAQLLVKRVIDVAAASLLLVVLAPLMAAIAVAVRATSPGEALFRQARVGRNGKPFTIYKFRTMVRDAPRSPLGSYCYANDPRITRVGRALRATSLDELPQLLNVVRGDMSFVGPRPDLPHHAERYTAAQRRRLDVRPGITGWAQVNGRNAIPWERRIELDLEYVARWSLQLDAAIGLRTIAAVLTGRGVKLPKKMGDREWKGTNQKLG